MSDQRHGPDYGFWAAIVFGLLFFGLCMVAAKAAEDDWFGRLTGHPKKEQTAPPP